MPAACATSMSRTSSPMAGIHASGVDAARFQQFHRLAEQGCAAGKVPHSTALGLAQLPARARLVVGADPCARRTPPSLTARSIASTPGNRGMSPICAAFSRRMCRAIVGASSAARRGARGSRADPCGAAARCRLPRCGESGTCRPRRSHVLAEPGAGCRPRCRRDANHKRVGQRGTIARLRRVCLRCVGLNRLVGLGPAAPEGHAREEEQGVRAAPEDLRSHSAVDGAQTPCWPASARFLGACQVSSPPRPLAVRASPHPGPTPDA